MMMIMMMTMIMMTMTVMIILLLFFYFAVNGLNCPFNHNQKQCSWTALQGEVYWKYMDHRSANDKTEYLVYRCQ